MAKHQQMSIGVAVITVAAILGAQEGRPASPRGSAETQVAWTETAAGLGERLKTGKWIEITYGRPIKRDRANLFGSGADYGKALSDGAPVWRAGADASTRLKTEVPLNIGGKTVPAGEYSLFIDLKPDNWTLIVSSWAARPTFEPQDKNALFGAYDYTPDKDVARPQMTLGKLPLSIDQLTWGFADVTQKGGRLVLMWDTVLATVPFTVGH
jgi:hypothetical protein